MQVAPFLPLDEGTRPQAGWRGRYGEGADPALDARGDGGIWGPPCPWLKLRFWQSPEPRSHSKLDNQTGKEPQRRDLGGSALLQLPKQQTAPELSVPRDSSVPGGSRYGWTAASEAGPGAGSTRPAPGRDHTQGPQPPLWLLQRYFDSSVGLEYTYTYIYIILDFLFSYYRLYSGYFLFWPGFSLRPTFPLHPPVFPFLPLWTLPESLNSKLTPPPHPHPLPRVHPSLSISERVGSELARRPTPHSPSPPKRDGGDRPKAIPAGLVASDTKTVFSQAVPHMSAGVALGFSSPTPWGSPRPQERGGGIQQD